MTKLFGTQIQVAGVNHSTTPIEIREKLAISNDHVSDALYLLSRYVSQGVILSTCNRTEIYSVTEGSYSSWPGIDFLKAWANISGADLQQYLYSYQNEAAVEHLFRVAAGLDSLIIGEFEILGQIKQSFEKAKRASLVGLPLQNLFQQALHVGRLVREKTGISRNALSVSSVAVELAAKAIGDLTRCTALVIGSGEAGRLVAKSLKERGIAQIITTSRSYKKASRLAMALGGSAVSIDNLSQQLVSCDIIISCTGAPHFILDRRTVQTAIQHRTNKPLVIIDIAVPRDVEPEVRQFVNVFLYDIDDFIYVSELNRRQREAAVEDATKIIEAEVNRFINRWQAMEVKPIISSLVKKAEYIRQRQLSLTLKKLPQLSPEEQVRIDVMTKAIVQKILHDPIQCLKNDFDGREDYVALVKKLFRVDER